MAKEFGGTVYPGTDDDPIPIAITSIRMPKGSRVLNFVDLAREYGVVSEIASEVLLPRGGKYRVRSMRKEGNAVYLDLDYSQ
jgi:hypothetical protein